jgi:hypothetical protein
MKRLATWATGLMFVFSASAGARVLNPDYGFPDQSISRGADDSSHTASVMIKFKEISAASPLQIKENSNLVESPLDDSGLTKDFSVSEPVASSSGPAATKAPMPQAGWIGLAGVLGVMVARWYSAAKRHRAKSAAG